ncbi:MAG: hypothetical protein ABSB79_08415 [Syntrophales bacterium]
MDKGKQKIFISCGQETDMEKKLGQDIVSLVKNLTPYEPYFAEVQTTLEGLTTNIFGALNQAAGLIAVLHHRGAVSPGGFIRASVWVEQEIALAAFVQQILGRNLYVSAFIQTGVKLEGVRSQLLLNPVEFDTNEQVVNHLKKVLPSWNIVKYSENLSPLNIIIRYEKVNIKSERNDYRLVVVLTNTGNSPISKYHVDLKFPSRLIEQPEKLDIYVRNRSNKIFAYFRTTEESKGDIFPGDSLRIMNIPYYVDNDIFFNVELSKMVVEATVYTHGYNPRKVEKSMTELQTF